MDESRAEVPKILDERVSENGDIFGFGELTRPILEMAHDMYATELKANVTTFEPGHFPLPTEFFEHVLFRMLTDGRRSGSSVFSDTTYPAGRFYDQIFTKEVSEHLQPMFDEFSRNRYW